MTHHFEETIAGRAYLIEVTPVSNRWRAQLRRLPGMPTAMMPFYGQTPEEAAREEGRERRREVELVRVERDHARGSVPMH